MQQRKYPRGVGKSFVIMFFVLGAGILLLGCGGSGDDDDAGESNGTAETPGTGISANGGSGNGPERLAQNQVCPPETPEADDGFCEFVAVLVDEQASTDARELLQRLSPRQLDCETASALCEGDEETVEVVPFTRNDEGGEARLDEARAEISSVVDGLDAGAEDDRGTGALQLYAIATGITEQQDKAIVFTGITGDSERMALMLHVVEHEGEWLFTSVHHRDDGSTFLDEIDRRQGAGSFWKWQLVETIEQVD